MCLFLTVFIFPDLKTLPYFHGIDWTKVALRVNPTPFEQNQRQINQNDPIDLVSLLNIRPYEELNVKVAKRLSSKLIEKSSESNEDSRFFSHLQILHLLPPNTRRDTISTVLNWICEEEMEQFRLIELKEQFRPIFTLKLCDSLFVRHTFRFH